MMISSGILPRLAVRRFGRLPEQGAGPRAAPGSRGLRARWRPNPTPRRGGSRPKRRRRPRAGRPGSAHGGRGQVVV